MDWTDHFVYDPSIPNGIRWARSVANNRIKAGTPAGSEVPGKDGKQGYYHVHMADLNPANHRIIWEMHYGPIPEGMLVDHRDGNTFNNVLANFRLVTNQVNCYNQVKRVTNTSGTTGVHLADNGNGKLYWSAQWTEDGKRKKVNFSVEAHGSEVARQLATKARADAVARLKANGMDITERHGQ